MQNPLASGPLSDLNYLYAVLSFLIGSSAGFQGVYERWQNNAARASLTFPGLVYLFTRGALPALVFVLLYRQRVIESQLVLWALVCGTGAEALLRSKLFIKHQQGEELSRGLFDLLQWYQNIFLESAATRLAELRRKFVEAQLPTGVQFLALCDRVSNNAPAWPDQQAQTDIRTAVSELKTEFQKKQVSDGDTLEQRYRRKLVYKVLDLVGRRGSKTLLALN
jgi:hypothetical protein